ncbi:MAG TPA: SOS response-associated peptidase [Burkholderiales bacterium]|jgi:putative SOS response-associated peptidase YedK|nr:SOS response-associated peptidase [Burkholderiales bacterium]
MCGRYVSPEQAAIERVWHAGRSGGTPFPRRFNVQPTSLVPVLKWSRTLQAVQLAQARWGLIPTWWKGEKPPRLTFNARVEEAATKPMWRHCLQRARCLLPAEGWYEWQEVERVDPATGEVRKVRQPCFIRLAGGKLFCFAGLMAPWSPPGKEEPLLTCSILTRPATAALAAIHPRMPLALPDDSHAAWLDPTLTQADEALELARAHALSEFEHYPVSARVNKAGNDDPDLIRPLDS